MRCPQPPGLRGSLKWIQQAVNHRSALIDELILLSLSLPSGSNIEWLSPVASDEFAEFRDRQFLQKIGQQHLAGELGAFWPVRGPQWDALARADTGEIILVEAKAHIGEIFSSGCQASGESREQIARALDRTIVAFHAKPRIDWTSSLYQMANRLCHLEFLTRHGVPARLVNVCFVGDSEMEGPRTVEEWQGALQVARYMLGLPKRHPGSQRIIDVFPHVSAISMQGSKVPVMA